MKQRLYPVFQEIDSFLAVKFLHLMSKIFRVHRVPDFSSPPAADPGLVYLH